MTFGVGPCLIVPGIFVVVRNSVFEILFHLTEQHRPIDHQLVRWFTDRGPLHHAPRRCRQRAVGAGQTAHVDIDHAAGVATLLVTDGVVDLVLADHIRRKTERGGGRVKAGFRDWGGTGRHGAPHRGRQLDQPEVRFIVRVADDLIRWIEQVDFCHIAGAGQINPGVIGLQNRGSADGAGGNRDINHAGLDVRTFFCQQVGDAVWPEYLVAADVDALKGTVGISITGFSGNGAGYRQGVLLQGVASVEKRLDGGVTGQVDGSGLVDLKHFTERRQQRFRRTGVVDGQGTLAGLPVLLKGQLQMAQAVTVRIQGQLRTRQGAADVIQRTVGLYFDQRLLRIHKPRRLDRMLTLVRQMQQPWPTRCNHVTTATVAVTGLAFRGVIPLTATTAAGERNRHSERQPGQYMRVNVSHE